MNNEERRHKIMKLKKAEKEQFKYGAINGSIAVGILLAAALGNVNVVNNPALTGIVVSAMIAPGSAAYLNFKNAFGHMDEIEKLEHPEKYENGRSK